MILKKRKHFLFWKLGKVEELIRSSDGAVRSAKIKVLNSDSRKPIIIRRPVQHLIPLEIHGNEAEESVEGPTQTTEPLQKDDSTNVTKPVRPRRKTAAQGELLRKLSKQM